MMLQENIYNKRGLRLAGIQLFLYQRKHIETIRPGSIGSNIFSNSSVIGNTDMDWAPYRLRYDKLKYNYQSTVAIGADFMAADVVTCQQTLIRFSIIFL